MKLVFLDDFSLVLLADFLAGEDCLDELFSSLDSSNKFSLAFRRPRAERSFLKVWKIKKGTGDFDFESSSSRVSDLASLIPRLAVYRNNPENSPKSPKPSSI